MDGKTNYMQFEYENTKQMFENGSCTDLFKS